MTHKGAHTKQLMITLLAYIQTTDHNKQMSFSCHIYVIFL
jgi:hypothetical protein